MYKLAFKNAFLFIGAMIGAGFATGAELMVFFRACNVLTVILSALLIGVLSMVFVCFGKIMAQYPKFTKALDIIMIANSLITFITMQAGVEELFVANYNIIGIGLLTAIIIAILSAFSLDFTKKLNVIVIPIVIVMIVLLFVIAKPPIYTGKFKPLQAINYASMNLLLGGYLIAKDGQNIKLKHNLAMGSIIFVVIGAMMVIMLSIAKLEPIHAMPIYAVAIVNSMGGVACAIIYLAILTTIIGAGKVVTMGVNTTFNTRWHGSVFLIALAIATYGASFKFMVDTFYPITGYVGVVVCCIICIIVMFNALKLSGRSIFCKQKRLGVELNPS